MNFPEQWIHGSPDCGLDGDRMALLLDSASGDPAHSVHFNPAVVQTEKTSSQSRRAGREKRIAGIVHLA
jgi:hypothetical protein